MGEESKLVCTIEIREGRRVITRGPEFTADREFHAVLLFEGLPLNPTLDKAVFVPNELIEALKHRVRRADLKTARLYSAYGAEEPATGHFFAELATEKPIVQSGWRLALTYQGYSPRLKEPLIGADAGVLIDIVDPAGVRIVKALWFQVKRAYTLPSRLETLRGAVEQHATMSKFTDDGYVLVFTASGIRVVAETDIGNTYSPEELFARAAECSKGDRNPSVIASTLDARHVLQVLITLS